MAASSGSPLSPSPAVRAEVENEVRPLTRTSKDSGRPYRRDPGVEEQIAQAIALDGKILVQRASVTNKDDPAYLKEESLVYLVRHYHLGGKRGLAESLSKVLLDRCVPFIKTKLRRLGIDRAEDAESEVIEGLFSRILDATSDRGDFFQVRFWAFLDRLLSDATRKQARLSREAKMQDNPDWISGSEVHAGDDAGERHGKPVAAPGLSAEQRTLIQDALTWLDEPYRTLVVLRHYDGWPVESSDPHEPTISRYFNKTPRTIRNWMAAADDRLRAWREGAA